MIVFLKENDVVNRVVLMYASIVAKQNKDGDTYRILKNRYDGINYEKLSLDEVMKLQ